jgi:hypothetical protein
MARSSHESIAAMYGIAGAATDRVDVSQRNAEDLSPTADRA